MRWPSQLIVKLVLGNTLLIALALAFCAKLILEEVENLTRTDLAQHLRSQATLLHETLGHRISAENAEELNRLMNEFASSDPIRSRVTVTLADGTVLADSAADAAKMENHSDRPEIIDALNSDEGWGQATRYSKTVGEDLLYVARRVGVKEEPVATIRVALTMQSISRRVEANERLIWRVVLLGFGAACVFAMGLGMLWSRPIRRITVAARSLSRGDLTARARVVGSDELAGLAQSLNQMRDNLANQMDTIERHKRTLASLLTQLQEGVIVVDAAGKLVLINPAAQRLLGLAAGAEAMLIGKPVVEFIKDETVIGMLQAHKSPSYNEQDEARIQVQLGSRQIWILARAGDIVLPGSSMPQDPGEHRISGRLLVLTDVTEFQQMIQMKTDFAANASHELRTPLSAIRGATETLLDIDFTSDPQRAHHFVDMIDRHSSRLESIMNDLLDLSRIESSPTRFKASAISLHEVLTGLYQRHQEKLAQKGIQWVVDKPADLDAVMLNSYLIRLILDNLVDNACKFTPEGGTVAVRCRRHLREDTDGSQLEISVSDTGAGIPEEDRDRVFERFYQVSRDRAGTMPGTGLGLSIVRHGVSAMKGTVKLTSTLGEGTTFSIYIPQNE